MLPGDRYGGGNGDVQMELQQDTIFVQGLPDDVTEEGLAQHFGSIGVIKVSSNLGIWYTGWESLGAVNPECLGETPNG